MPRTHRERIDPNDPQSDIEKFREGNRRYVAGTTEIVVLRPQQRRELAQRQDPLAGEVEFLGRFN